MALDEAAKGNTTVNFDEKTYAPLEEHYELLVGWDCKLTICDRHDEFKATIDELRASADPSNKELYDEACAKFCKSMNTTLTNHIR